LCFSIKFYLYFLLFLQVFYWYFFTKLIIQNQIGWELWFSIKFGSKILQDTTFRNYIRFKRFAGIFILVACFFFFPFSGLVFFLIFLSYFSFFFQFDSIILTFYNSFISHHLYIFLIFVLIFLIIIYFVWNNFFFNLILVGFFMSSFILVRFVAVFFFCKFFFINIFLWFYISKIYLLTVKFFN